MKILAQSTCTASDQHKNQDPLCIFGPALLCQRSGVLCTLTSQTQPPLVSTCASNEGYPKVRNHGEGPY